MGTTQQTHRWVHIPITLPCNALWSKQDFSILTCHFLSFLQLLITWVKHLLFTAELPGWIRGGMSTADSVVLQRSGW